MELARVVPEQAAAPSLTLYRKHRPMVFDELVGQPTVVTGLEAAVAAGRVAHAYLFAGPRGTGKTSAARILAKCLNCQRGGPTPSPCGECEACVSIASGTAFDVVEIDAASNRGINEIRELRERVKFAPAHFRKKVYIVDEVHMLTPEAFNALLKTLEEPPDNVVFVLATTEYHKVPQTILSRCQRYEFRRMSPSDIAGRLNEVATREGIASEPAALERIAFLADGALRDALVLLEQARGFASGDVISDAVLDAAFGAPVFDAVERAAEAVAASDAQATLAAIAEAVDRGADPGWLAKELLRWFRLSLLAQVSPELLATEVPPETAERIKLRAARIPRSKILAALRNLSEIISQRYSAQPRIDLELALIRVILPNDELSMQTLSDRLRTLEEKLGAAPTAVPTPISGAPPSSPPTPKKTPATVGANAPAPPGERKSRTVRTPQAEEVTNGVQELSLGKLQALWPHVVNTVKDRSKPCFGHLEHARLVEFADNRLTLSVPSKFNRDLLAEPIMTKIIAEAIFEVSGSRPNIACVVGAVGDRPVPSSTTAAESSAFKLAETVLGADLF